MKNSFENVCFAPECVGEVRIRLCAKHSETIAPELVKMYYSARQRWAEERDKALSEAKAREEREALEARQRWFAYKAKLKPKLMSALDEGNDDNLRKLLNDLSRNTDWDWFRDGDLPF